MWSGTFRSSSSIRIGLAATLALTAGVVGLGGAQVRAQEVTGSLSIQKVVNASTVSPGETFEYTIQVQCTTAVVDGCTNAVLTDPLPDYITLNGDIAVTGALTPPLVDTASDGSSFTVTFQDPLEPPTVGLAPGQVVTITVPVVLDPTIPVEENGVELPNTATITADNADQKESTATVVPEVPETVAVATTKTIEPPSQTAGATDPITLSLTGTNTSNVPVETLVIQDPIADPPPDDVTSPFFYLEITDVGTPALPPNADEVLVEVYDPGVDAWVDASTADLSTATGVRYTFTDTSGDGIVPGATTSVDITLVQRTGPDAAVPPVVIDNDVSTTVDRDGDPGTTDDQATAEASDNFNIRTSELDVTATKTIEPPTINAGEPATVTLTGLNGAVEPLTEMTITEPAPNANNPFEGPNAVTFTGFTDGVRWPADATSASITYECAGTGIAPIVATDVDTLPDPPESCDPVTGFEVTFTAEAPATIVPGGQAQIPFTIDTPEAQTLLGNPVDQLLRLNIVRVTGTDGQNSDFALAADTLLTIVDRLDVVTEKEISPAGGIPGRPGQVVIVELTGTVLPFPDSTVDATTIVVQDPSVMADPNAWFDAFAPQSVTATPVPDCATLTVQYTVDPTGADGSWQDVPGFESITGPTIVNEALPDVVSETAEGIRFVYTAAPAGGGCEGGFPPGTSVAPNVAFGVRPGGPADLVAPEAPATFTDCAGTSAEAATVPEVVSPEACVEIPVTPVPGDGGVGLDPIDKVWDDLLLNARSQQQSGVTISWSTQGYSGLEAVVITDMADAANTPLPDSVYDAFDLVRIDPIPSGTAADPHLTYDQITAVELYQLDPGSADPGGGTWIAAPGDPCPCDASFPGYTVPAELRSTVIGFRLTYAESPTREARLDASAPPVGTGVAPSNGNDREIHPVFELRDELRSDPLIPVIDDDAILFNTGTPGFINNTVDVVAYFDVDEDPAGTWTAEDDIEITNVPLLVQTTKTWTGGPLGVPEAGVGQEDYPISRITLTGTNATPAKIDELVITDDTAGDAFEWFNLVGFSAITPPGDIGADDVLIELDGTVPPGFDGTREAALALTEADLVGVTGFTITYSGRININEPAGAATATVEIGMRLRTEGRTTSTPPAPGQTVDNQVTTTVSDLVDYPGFGPVTLDTTADASIELVAQGIDIIASKNIEPTSQTEPNNDPFNVTIGGQPAAPDGSPLPPSRAVEMVLTDDDPRFWNQYDFVSLSDIAFATPINRVRVDALTGGTWSIGGGGEPVLTGETWQIGTVTAGPTLSLPAGVLPAQVQGLRFTFTRDDGANWENPANPLQQVTFQAQRRIDLHTGGPVPSDLFGTAPGETVAGQATDEMTAQVFSSDVDGQGLPLTATDNALDTILYLHATNSVQVRKTPDGVVSPGAPFTYTLTVTNNGDVDITNPVITDYLPVDAEGPMVSLADPPNFTYAITDGTGMPTDAALVTITDASTALIAPTLTFTFPDGSTLPIGATYTISFRAVLRPGLPAGTEFTNEVGVVGDRPWDACDGDPSDEIDQQTGECVAEATNSVLSAGAISVSKLVQAEGSDELGVTLDPMAAFSGACTADTDGFYARPCVPIAEPGGEITWRMRFVNTGNRDIDRILGIDNLPAIGDTTATAPLARGSQWEPVFTGERPTLVDPSFGTLNVWYTTGPASCSSGVEPVDDALICDALDWVEWPEGTALPVDPATVNGIQVEILPATPLAPAETVDVDLTMTAPAYDPEADYTAPQNQPDKQTYNTVGTAGRWLGDDESTGYTLVTEPPRVGVALANGPLAVLKIVTGDAAEFAPSTYRAQLECISVGEQVPLPLLVRNVDLTPGVPQTINNLPWGAECTLSERDPQGATSTTPGTAVVTRDGEQIATATVTNVYDDAPLSITKTVDSDAVDQDGTAVTYGPFTVTVRCQFLDAPAYADGYGLLRPMNFTLADDDDVINLTGIPVGASCTITETDDKGAANTTIDVTLPEASTSTDGTSTVVELEDPTDVTITNEFTVGQVAIEKVVTGNLDAPGAAGPFLVAMTCTLDDESGSRIVFADEILLGGGAPLSATIANLATGAQCVFTETGSSGADAITMTPAGGVTVGDGTVTTLTVTNTYTTGSVSITKVVTGNGAAVGATGPFVIRVRCTLADEMGLTTVVYDADVVLGGANPLTATIDDLPTGAHCDFQETDSRGGIPSISPVAGVDVGDGTVVSVTVTNTFQVAPLPPTGGSVGRTLSLAALVLALGSVAMVIGHRRRAPHRS